jgi:glycosyltransferase involved in cell wall biosynthesis
MPKVLRIINRFNIGGPTYNATFLTKFLGDDFETLLIGGLPENDEKDSLHILEQYGVEAKLIPELQRTPNLKSDRAAYKRIKQIIEEFKPDIVHTHAAKAGAIGRKAALSCGVKVIVHTYHGHVFHSYFGKLKTLLYKKIERQLAKKTTAIVAISELQKKELCYEHKIAPENKFHVISLGFDLSKFQENLSEKRKKTRERLQLSESDIAVAIVGRLVPIKNHSLFLDAIELLAKESVFANYYIVGDGSERNTIETRVKELLAIYPVKITLIGWETDIATFNAGMDVLCLTSNNEGTPVSLIEAQAGNLPIVTTDVGGVRDIVKDEETAFVVPPKNAEQFAQKLKILIQNEKIREKMSQNGWTYVKDNFDYRTLTKNMRDLYYKLLTEK